MTGLLIPRNRRKLAFFACVRILVVYLGQGNFRPVYEAVLFFSEISFLGEVLSSQIEG